MPGLKGALSIRVNDGVTDRIVTRYCRGLKFTKVAPGGHRDMSFTMVLPRNTFSDLGPADTCWLYDARTGKTIFGQAYLENPTPTDGPDGQQYDVQAMGGMALASDETRALIYISSDLGDWERETTSFSSGSQETFGTGLRVQFPSGNTVPNGVFVGARNNAFVRAGMTIGALRVTSQSGITDAGYQLGLNNSGLNLVVLGDTTPRISTVLITDTKWIVTDLTSPSTYLIVFILRQGLAVNVTGDVFWSQLEGLTVLGQRMDRFGTLLTGAAGLVSAAQVLASQVVEDLLGRLLTFCDPATAQVDATAFGITQLSYPDGVKAADLLNQLTVFEPDFLWEILETLDNGKHRFNLRAWPVTNLAAAVSDSAQAGTNIPARYEVSTRDGWKQKGSDADLCNRILVSWTDPTGAAQVTPVLASSLGLVGIGLPVDQLGTRIKDADPVTLPDGFGSLTNATRIGGQILTDKINPPKAGTVLVRRPIMDRLTGNQVMPWELEPGYLCRVRETGDDLRITQVDYDDDSCSMLLTLGTPVLTNEQRLARLTRSDH